MTDRRQAPWFFRFASILLFFALAGALRADDRAGSSAGPRLTAESVAAWADRAFPEALEAHQVSGAVVSVVRNGRILLEKGYGLANVETGSPASPTTTRVRIGSTTKTFTATLLAEMLEEGRIASLDDPANRYLKRFRLPDNDGEPITLRHLLTHTAGFEDRFFNIGAVRPVAVPASADMIESLRPAYVRPAGKRVVYSNFGVAVLGWLLEDLTGEPIAELMRERLFRPLGMDQTVLPVTLEEPEGLAVPGILDAGGVVGPVPYTAINPALAQTGSIVSTAHDMALYMNAQLGTTALLDPSVRKRLQTRLAGNAPGITAIGMVYFLDRWAGRRSVSHGGNWDGFHSWMLLLPDQRAGIFISLLSDAERPGVVDRFVDAVLPDRAGPPSAALLSALPLVNSFQAALFGPKRRMPQKAAAADLQAYAGLYRGDRRPFKTAEALSSLVYYGADVMEVTAGIDGLYLGSVGPWVPEGKGRFILDIPDRPRMVFSTDPQIGQRVLVPDIGIYSFTRIGRAQNPKWQGILVHILVPITLLGLFAAGGLGRKPLLLAPFLEGVAGAVMIGCATLGLGDGDSLMAGYFAGEPARLALFVIAANVQFVASVVTLFAARVVAPGSRAPARYLLLALGIAGLVSAAILAQYNVIGLHRL